MWSVIRLTPTHFSHKYLSWTLCKPSSSTEVQPGSARGRGDGQAPHPPEPRRVRHRQGRRPAEGVPRAVRRRHQGLPAVLPPVHRAHRAHDRARAGRLALHHLHSQDARRRAWALLSLFYPRFVRRCPSLASYRHWSVGLKFFISLVCRLCAYVPAWCNGMRAD